MISSVLLQAFGIGLFLHVCTDLSKNNLAFQFQYFYCGCPNSICMQLHVLQYSGNATCLH